MVYLRLSPLPCSPFFEQLRFERLAVGHLVRQCGFEFGTTLSGLLGRDMSIAGSLLVRAFQSRRGIGQFFFDLRGPRGCFGQPRFSLLFDLGQPPAPGLDF